MKVGIIGGGFGLCVQAPIIYLHPESQVAAFSTITRHQYPEDIPFLREVTHYKDWRKMLSEEELDLVCVSTNPSLHYEVAKEVIRSGRHIICEKPFTTNASESAELLQLATEYNVKAAIDFEWRFLPAREQAKQFVAQGKLGQLLHIDCMISSANYQQLRTQKLGWLGQKASSGGMLGALGSHLLDFLRWITQDEVNRIHGTLHTHLPRTSEEERDADDTFMVQGVMHQGTTFNLQLLRTVQHSFGSIIRIYGTEGTISILNDSQFEYGKAQGQMETFELNVPSIPPHLSPVAQRYYPAFSRFFSYMVHWIQTGEKHPNLSTFVDGHENQILLDTIYKQNE